MSQTAIYSLSADPITFGHINIIERASKSFEKVIVAIGNNPTKKYLLTQEERLQVASDSLFYIDNVQVVVFEGLLVDFAFLNNVDVIIRGLRNIEDFQYEQDLNSVNNSILDTIDTFYLLSEPDKHHISSSTAKALVKENVFSHEYLSLSAKQILELKINNQIFVGVTGLVGAGKSYISRELVKYSESLDNIPVHNIDIDLLAHKIYKEKNPLFIKVRKQIQDEFGTLDRTTLGTIVFNDAEKLNTLNSIFKSPLELLIRQAVSGLTGIILLNGATIISDYFLPICNNNILFIDTCKEIRKMNCISGRKMDAEKFYEIDSVMISKEQQYQTINRLIIKHNFGETLEVSNDRNLSISEVYESLLSTFSES